MARNMIAKTYGGHPFEDKYACLTDLQVMILYRQAFSDKEREANDKFELIKTLSKAWSEKFDGMLDMLLMFTNPEFFEKKTEIDNLRDLGVELEEGDFLETFKETMAAVPKHYKVIEEGYGGDELTDADNGFADFVTGFKEQREALMQELKG